MSVDKDHFFAVLNSKALLQWAQAQKKPTKRSKTAAPGGEEAADAAAEAVRQGVLQGKTVEEKLKYILITYVNNAGWWEQVAATEAVGLPIIHSMRITDTVSPNLHLAHKACQDMQVLVPAAMQEHPLAISDEDGAAVEKVIDSRIKDCVSQACLAAGGVNPQYVYGTELQLWPPGVLGSNVAMAIQGVICDYFAHLKVPNLDLYKYKTVSAMKEWTAWSQKQLPVLSIFNTELALEAASSDSAGEYWLVYWRHLEHFGPFALNLSHQQSGQGASERLHNAEKRISTKTRSTMRSDVKTALTEVKMATIRKRSEHINQLKTYQRTDRVTILGLVCEKMAKRVATVQMETEVRQVAQSLARMPQAVSQAGANEAVDDEGAEDEIWAVTDITEDDEQDQEDVVAALLELAQWECISVEEQ